MGFNWPKLTLWILRTHLDLHLTYLADPFNRYLSVEDFLRVPGP